MSEFKFAIGQFVRIRESAKKVNKKYVKDNTYGTVDSVFEIVSRYPPTTIRTNSKSVNTPSSYFVTARGKQFSTVAMNEDELESAGKASPLIYKSTVPQCKTAICGPNAQSKSEEFMAHDELLVELDDVTSFM